MNAQHTQGRLKVQHPHAGERGWEIALEPGLEQVCQDVTEANARRLVACWNMLVGETTEDIEANPLPAMFDQMSAHLAQLQKNADAILAQRDELVSACKLLIDYCDKHPPMGDSLWSVQLIRAAIKKAEGCAA